MKDKAMSVVIIVTAFLVLGCVTANIEIPTYEVVSSYEDIEIRRYEPMIIAEVEVGGDRRTASSRGFSLLADYIFGNNTKKETSEKIAMTAPVQQQESQKIAMTAPVQQTPTDRSWKVNFVMPAEYTIDTLPTPNNSRVVLKELPSRTFVVICFSGGNSDGNMRTHEEELMNYIEQNDISIVGAPVYAFYDPPFTLNAFRRNEIMLEIVE